jgi:hypothetical protein
MIGMHDTPLPPRPMTRLLSWLLALALSLSPALAQDQSAPLGPVGGVVGASTAPGGSSGDVQCNVSSAFGACQTGLITAVTTGTFNGLNIGSSSGSDPGGHISYDTGAANGVYLAYSTIGDQNGFAAYPYLNVGQAGTILGNQGNSDHSDIFVRNIYTLSSTENPALTSCGTGSPALLSGSTDMAGQVTEGTTTTGCVVTMGKTNYGQAPSCVVTFQSISAATPPGYTIGFSTGTVTITVTNVNGTGLKFNYHCIYFS